MICFSLVFIVLLQLVILLVLFLEIAESKERKKYGNH